MPFKPGQSGNPNGRARKSPDLASELRAALGRKVDTADGPKPHRRVVVDSLLTAAEAGDVAAIKLVFDRTLGKLPEPLQLSGPNGEPLVDVAGLRAAFLAAERQAGDAE